MQLFQGFILFRGIQIEAIFAGWLKPFQKKKTNLDWDNVELSLPEEKKLKSIHKRVITYEKARFMKELMFVKHHNSWQAVNKNTMQYTCDKIIYTV